jgi:DNA-binding IclR family transcriptional regulator
MNNGWSANRADTGAAASPTGSTAQVQSVDRALSILEYLAEHGTGGVTEIAKSLEVHKSTAFRLVGALENRHLVEQVEERGKYRLGFGLIRLAAASSAQLDLTKMGRPVCARLAGELGETVNIAVLDSGAAVNVAQEHAGAVVATRNWVGRRTPLHATSSGKVLLAHDDDTADTLLAADLERFTPHTLTDPHTLREELAEVRFRDWASCTEELEIGLNAVAAPIYGADGLVLASMSLSGPSYRLTRGDLPSVAERVLGGADEISARLGFHRRRGSDPERAPEAS